VSPEVTERLKVADIRVMAQGQYFCLFVRDGCVGMVPRSSDLAGLDRNGSSGLSLDEGLGYLVFREGTPIFVGQGFEVAATEEQVEKVRQFTLDLQHALGFD